MYANCIYYSASEEQRLNALYEEFSYKVKFDFKRIVFIGVKQDYIKDFSEIVNLASELNGYQSHRSIKYRERIYHLYVRYSTSHEATKATAFFRNQDGLHAEIVDSILKTWYAYEMRTDRDLRPTICYLDVVGEVAHTDPLTEDTARSLLMKFGEPEILDVKSDHVKVAFPSIAEGIGACIMYGRWFVKSTQPDSRFYYRVQLEKSDYFSLMTNRGVNPAVGRESFHMDYFSPRPSTPNSSDPIFNYGNANPNNDYLVAEEPRNARNFHRGRGNNRFQRPGRRGRNFQSNRFRNNENQQQPMNYASAYHNVRVYQPSNPSMQNSARNFQNV